MQTAILFGSSLGNTQFIAEKISKELPHADCLPVNDLLGSQLLKYDHLILGTSTWGIGNLQDDFELFVDLLLSLDMSQKTFALFGLGDQHTYPDTFCNGMGKLYQLLVDKGWNVVGKTSIEGYDFSESEAVIGEEFVGLALDEDNEPDLSDSRIRNWVKQLPF
ncbi:flavodoxin [Carboxylicivirga sp. M1479]|uniref:flavodoxin n=1 Tax=Carboxylicivirga sp. M1479 TaxID=2594476 RepID=UPI001177E460|nr:flavodoxin [Carboxylicivirga sp. M1479]TRX66463.1 flavodoxin [Carboxylicivirga sp. M1479]